MILSFLLLSLFSINAVEINSLKTYTDPFANFGKENYGIVHPNSAATEYAIFSNQIIIKDPFNNTFLKLDKDGNTVAEMIPSSNTSTLWEASQIYWDRTTFIVPTNSGLQRYKYTDFSLDISFGDNGTVTNPITGKSILFLTVIKNDMYYYAAGYNTNTSVSVIARFTLDGQLDRSFNADSTPGYFEFQRLNNGPFEGGPIQILFLKDSIIVRLYHNQLISFPLNGPYISEHLLNAFPRECNLEADILNPNSFFAASSNGLFLLTSTLEQDTSFNMTGNIPLPAIFADCQIIRPWALRKINNKIFIAGYSKDANGADHGFVVCYDISNRKYPKIDTSFFKTGYLILDNTLYTTTTIMKILFDSSSPIPSLFLCGPNQIARLILEENFMRTALVSQTVSQRLLFDEANNKLVPLIAGMFH